MTLPTLALEDIGAASDPDHVLEIFDRALTEVGAEYHAIVLFPIGKDIEDGAIAWKVRSDWRALYSGKKLFQRDPAVRQCRRTSMPFDWANSTYNSGTEHKWAEVMSLAHDFNVHKGILVPVLSPAGVVGFVWAAGPHFEERKRHIPYLHVLGLNTFHRLQQLGAAVKRTERLTTKERQILFFLSEGKSTWQIGCFFHIQQRTVEWHIEQACKKLGVADKFDAMAVIARDL